MRIRPLKLLALGLVALLPIACVYDPVYHGRPHGHHPAYYEPWGYYYYPWVDVYFHYSTGFYFYLSNGVWVRTRVLPSYIHLDPRNRVYLRIESNRPYIYHQRHVQKYRTGPHYRPTPQYDRQERQTNRNWYEQQQRYQREHRVAPPPTRNSQPSLPPRREQRDDDRDRRQPPIRYDAPRQPRPITIEPGKPQPQRRYEDRYQQERRQVPQPHTYPAPSPQSGKPEPRRPEDRYQQQHRQAPDSSRRDKSYRQDDSGRSKRSGSQQYKSPTPQSRQRELGQEQYQDQSREQYEEQQQRGDKNRN